MCGTACIFRYDVEVLDGFTWNALEIASVDPYALLIVAVRRRSAESRGLATTTPPLVLLSDKLCPLDIAALATAP